MHMHRSPFGNDPFAHQDELRKQFESNQVQFVLTELDTSATFSDVAGSASDPVKIKRNVANARTAYETALKFANGASFDVTSKTEFDTKLERAKLLLTALGEHF
jgi:hypothetical protein